MSTNYLMIAKQTDEEKAEMYMACTKQQLVSMLIECNKIIESLPMKVVSYDEDGTEKIDYFERIPDTTYLGEL